MQTLHNYITLNLFIVAKSTGLLNHYTRCTELLQLETARGKYLGKQVRFKSFPDTVTRTTSSVKNKQAVYRQNGVFVDNKDAQHAESDWLAIHTAQKYTYLHNILSKNKFPIYCE